MVSSSDSYIPKLTSHLHSDDVAFPLFSYVMAKTCEMFQTS